MTHNTTAPALTDEQRKAVEFAIELIESDRGDRTVTSRTLRALLTAPRAAGLPNLIEKIAEQWDGCFFDAPGGCDIDIGEAIRAAAKRLDAAPAAPVAEISAGTEPNPSKESGQSEAVISAGGFDDQAVAADGAPSDDLLQLDVLLANLHAAVWHAGAGDDGPVDYDMAGKDEAKAIQRHVRAMLAERAAVSPATAEPDLNALLEAAAVGLNREGMDEDARIVRGMKPGYPPKRNEPATADERAARDDGFFAGVCVALQVITAFDQGVMWAELVRACGTDELLQYAAHVEPEEWQLAGFEKYAFNELRKKKPKAGARASQAAAPAEAREPIYQSRLLKAPAWTDVSRTEFEACAAKPDQFEVRTLSPVTADAGEAAALRAEVDRLNAIINTPQAGDFLRAVSIEAEHQRQRWSCKHDSGKMPADWFWLVGYLAGKALHAHAVCDEKKAEHHIITTAAALANWHLAIFGKSDMRPGTELPSEKPRDCSGTPESCPDNEGYGCHCSDAARAQGGKGGEA
ncbi:hypothetical protein [Burkholderia gladioli]|uniref:hypothetical protein n=1 Tax=Burkholderia gladioli TaxID=28095 RepID=UPI001ABAF902|nr:hypothetical protein [Burkholderia gladioli]